MKRFTVFALILTVAVLLMGHLTFWVSQARAHSMTTTYEITENTRGPVTLSLQPNQSYAYSINSTDSDSQKFEISAVKRGTNSQEWQELQFKSGNIPDYENPADANTDNNYKITLMLADRHGGADPTAHTHDITIQVKNVAAPDKMSAPTLETPVAGEVKVSWTAVSHAYLTGYEVHWTNTTDSSDTDSSTVGNTLTSTTIASLTAGDTYNIKVRALSSEGNSVWSDTGMVRVNRAPTVSTIPAQTVAVNGGTRTINLNNYFSDPDGQTLHYTATSSNTSIATVSISVSNLTITGKGNGTATVTVTGSDSFVSVSQTIAISVENPPAAVGTIPTQYTNLGWSDVTVNVSSYFSEPDGQTLTYSASSSNTWVATVSVSGSTLTISEKGSGNATITVTASDPSGLSATQTFTVNVTNYFTGEADAIPGLSSTEQLLLGQLLTYNTIIFNELHNSANDANDWLELRNVSSIDIPLDEWQLRILTGNGNTVIPFPAGTVIPASGVLLITNTEMATADASVTPVVIDSFALPQSEFALILRSPNVFGDIAGNYYEGQKERPKTSPALTADTVWDRTQPIVSGYRAEAWVKSTYRNGLGSPGYQPSTVAGDLNNDGVVNILDLVMVASKFGTTSAIADLNGDNTVNIQDLVLVAGALSAGNAAPTAKQSDAETVNNWLKLARQNKSNVVKSAMPKGFSYERGIEVLEQLARALTPNKTALLANYPNPFNPETWIPYQLSKAADVTVTIYASDGNVVRTLALGHQAAGTYKNRSQAAYWDGKNEMGESVASGIYFYTLTAGDFSATRKMLILK